MTDHKGVDGLSEDELTVRASTYSHIAAGEIMAGDERAKNLIRNKGTLAIIIKNLISDCSGYTYAELVDMIGNVSDGQLLTADMDPAGVLRLSTEQDSIMEKLLRYDVYLRFCDKGNGNRISTIDIEIQRETDLPYPLIKRGIYYSCRSVCDQLGTVTGTTDFGKLHKVYSIWLMVKPEKNQKAGIATCNFGWSGDVELLPENFKSNSDLIQLDFVFAGELSGTDESKRELFWLVNGMYKDPKLLRKLFRCELPEDTEFEREAENYMTLTEDFFARGISEGWVGGKAEGRAEGKAEEKTEIALNMYLLGIGKDLILKSTGLSEEELDKLIKENAGHKTDISTEPYVFN